MKAKKILELIAGAMLIISLTACGATEKGGAQETAAESSTGTIQEEETQKVSTEQILAVLNSTFEDLGTWTYDEEYKCYVFHETGDAGIQTTVDLYLAGYKDLTEEPWKTVRESFISTAATLADATGEEVYIAIANPYNEENVLLTVDKDGTIYDALNE